MKNVKRVEDGETKLEAWLYFINQPDSELVQELEKIEIEIAKNAIQNGLDNTIISKLTGLSLSEIERLRIK